MAKFSGVIGFAVTKEKVKDGIPTGVFEEKVFEKRYTGDLLRNYRTRQTGEHLNDDIDITNQVSIIGDAFAFSNYFAMRYVKWRGASWKITSVEDQRPRLLLSLGGVYNGPKTCPAKDI